MEQNTNKQENTQNGSVRSRSEAEPMLVYYLNILRRRLPILIVFFVIALTVGLINAFRSPRIYQSAAKILVEKSTTRIKNLEGVIQDGSWWDPDYYNTQVELIRSRVVLDSALESLESARSQGLGHADKDDSSVIGVIKENVLAMFGSTPMPSKEEWEHARGQVHAVYMTGTHFILIKGESRSALYAAKLANAVARSYERYHVNQRKEMHTDVFAFLRKERDKEEQALNSSEQALQDFREKAKSVSLSDDKKKQPDIQRLDELNRELTDTQLKRINLTAHLKVIKEIQGKEKDPASRIRRLASVPVLKDSSTVVEAQKKLTKSEQVAASLSETYGSEHPLMKAAMADVGILKKQVKNSLYKSILAVIHEIRSLKAKEQELADQYEAQKVVALASAKESFQFARLQNEVNQHRRLFETISQRMQEVDVSSGFARTNAKVVESAEPSTVPIRPRKIRMVMLSVFFGLFLGVGLALFLENLDDTIKTPEDLKSRLNIPLLGFVPKMDNEKTKDGKPIAPATVSMTEPASSMSEAYRNIRTSLLISIPDSDVKILAFTSCGPSEGKTTMISNLAFSMAKSGKKVLLIDADLHRPMIHKVMGLDLAIGISTVLVGDCGLRDAVQSFTHDDTKVDNLDIVTAGPESPNPSELLGGEKMKEIMTEAREYYDWILIDTPPVLYVSDATIISAICEGVVLVVEAGHNNRAILTRALEQLENIHVRLIGAVLNKVVITRAGRYCSDYYHYGYSRYTSDYKRSYYGGRGDSSGPRHVLAEKPSGTLQDKIRKTKQE